MNGKLEGELLGITNTNWSVSISGPNQAIPWMLFRLIIQHVLRF